MTARDRTVLAVVAVVAVLAGCWMLLIQPKRKEAATLGAQVQTLQTQLSTAQATVAKGQAARGQFAAQYAALARLGEALPQDDNVPSLLYQLQSAATAAGVRFGTLQLVPGSSSATPAPATPPSTRSAAPAAGPSSASTSSATLPPGASVGPAGFPTEQFTLQFTGNFFHLANFFQRLQRFVVAGGNQILVSGRLMTINAISFAPGPSGFPQIAASVSATTYMAPAGTGLLAGASPSGPAGAPMAPAAATPTTAGPAPATITPLVR